MIPNVLNKHTNSTAYYQTRQLIVSSKNLREPLSKKIHIYLNNKKIRISKIIIIDSIIVPLPVRNPLKLADMDFISVSQFAELHDLPERTVRNWCAAGKMQGAVLVGKTWCVPADAPLPRKGQVKETPLLKRLREEKDGQVRGGIYHRTQIDLTYNSNHIEGSRLTHEQTRFIFETNTIGISDESVNVDDIVETTNHFRCIDLIIDQADEKTVRELD